MEAEFSTCGALMALLFAIVGIVFKVPTPYSLIFGAIAGGLLGSGNLDATIKAVTNGASSMTSPALRIFTSGILAGSLVKTGAAEKIAETIIAIFREKRAVLAICLASAVICAAGVFIDVAVITVAPIALAIGQKLNLSKAGVTIAMIGGGKAGNIVSPNPNTISTADIFGVDLTSLIARNIVPAILALTVAVFIASILSKRQGDDISENEKTTETSAQLPSFFASILGPIVILVLLAMRPLAGVKIDPILALPIGGLVCALATGKSRNFLEYSEFGLNKVVGVSILLISAGAIAGIISESTLKEDVTTLLTRLNAPTFALAPIAGVFFSAATASTTAGCTVGSGAFASTLIHGGVPAVAAGAMLHAGAITLDSLPHGSFFHATGGVVRMSFVQRAKLIPYEAAIGFVAVASSTAIYMIFGK
ncbi:MAG: GntP family permease [Thermoguttaceae bacterium]|nr:GntP family permease [Thermoguttaceae bacterium]